MVMTVHDENGNEVHISKDEAERIAGECGRVGLGLLGTIY